MMLISSREFAEAAQNATIRIVDGQVYVSSRDVVQLEWKEGIDFVVFAKLAAEMVKAKETFLFFHEYGIWPSSENQYLFRIVTKALFNEDVAGPGSQHFQFSCADHEAARTLLQIGLQSGWGGLLFGSNDEWFYFNHDGLGYLKSSSNVAEQFRSFSALTITALEFEGGPIGAR